MGYGKEKILSNQSIPSSQMSDDEMLGGEVHMNLIFNTDGLNGERTANGVSDKRWVERDGERVQEEIGEENVAIVKRKRVVTV